MVSIDSALEKFKTRYGSKVTIGEEAIDITDLLRNTRNRIINSGIRQGMRVYALPLIGGSRMFEKWRMDKEGKVQRDEKGRPIIKSGPKQIVAELVCTPKATNIGSDELIVGRETSMEGIQRETALSVFEILKISPEKDGYILFVRSPQQIRSAVREFGGRLRGVLTQGKWWKPPIVLHNIPLDRRFFRKVVGQVAGQVNPLIRKKMVARFFGGALASSHIRKQILPHLKKATKAKRK